MDYFLKENKDVSIYLSIFLSLSLFSLSISSSFFVSFKI